MAYNHVVECSFIDPDPSAAIRVIKGATYFRTAASALGTAMGYIEDDPETLRALGTIEDRGPAGDDPDGSPLRAGGSTVDPWGATDGSDPWVPREGWAGLDPEG